LGQFSIDPSSPNPFGIDDGVLIAAVQGAFFGGNLPAAQIEGLIAAHVPRKEISEVSQVYGTKWWDYRRLAPGHSFYLFGHHYYRATKAAARRILADQKSRSRDGRAGTGMLGVALTEMTCEGLWERDKGHITGLWKAMLVADAIGIPYPDFCRLACRIAIDRLWKRLPRPSQLYSEKLGGFVLDEWETLQNERLFLASHPMYAEENYAGLDVQDAYRTWLIGHLGKQPDPVMGLMEVVYVRKQLPEALAAQHFPPMALKRARLLAT
jgi:hypothetical protein